MIKQINLLPWREQRRKNSQQKFIFALVMAISLALAIIFSFDLWILHKNNEQQQCNSKLQNEINLLSNKTNKMQKITDEKRAILTQLKQLQELQGNKYLVPQLFAELIHMLPNEIVLTCLKREEAEIIVAGKAQSSTNVSDFMKNIERSSAFKRPMLEEIKTADQNYDNDFILQLQFK